MAIFVDVENMGCYHEILGLGMAICLIFWRFLEDLLAMCKTPLEFCGIDIIQHVFAGLILEFAAKNGN